MWALVTELLFSFVLLAFLVISCQNVLHIASGSVRSVLTYIHHALDHELGEGEGVADEEENVTTRVVRRRVILKGDEADNLPGEQVSEEHFTDEHGNIVTKKTVRKVVRRGKGEEGVQDMTEEDPNDLETEQYMSYAILGRDSSKPDTTDVKRGAQIVKCASLRRVKQ
ncbi:ankyrin-1a isoform X2 [Boleophthalmus pectinirostris]|uniref:ankyrin-1a isoform X2 n=1 Tax=Boleophthalmus pectinirostris TaxID=150288 RepID=UPI00242D9953|nr:ankyrin-1a isoform X2 [Boleophthalmus pectinirostris]